MNNSCFHIESKEDGRQISGKFTDNGVLFLVLARDGLSLVSEPKTGALPYATFSKRGRKIFGSALHEVCMLKKRNGKNSERHLIEGDEIRIGLSTYVVVKNKKKLRVKISKLILMFALIFSFLSALFLFIVPRLETKTRLAKTQQIQKETFKDTETIKAREYLRSGQTAQAKLSLMEVLEKEPDNEPARKLLMEIEEGGYAQEEQRAKDLNESNNEEASRLFEEGLELKNNGKLLEARDKFELALEIVRKQKIPPPFTASLETTKAGVTDEIADNVSMRLSGIEGVISDAGKKNPTETIRQLVVEKNNLDEIGRIFPEHEKLPLVRKKLDEVLKISSGKLISGALVAEKMSGCKKALPMYENILRDLGDSLPVARSKIEECVKRCNGTNFRRKI